MQAMRLEPTPIREYPYYGLLKPFYLIGMYHAFGIVQLIFIFRFRRGLFYGMLLFGCVLFAAGVSFAMYYHKRAQASQGTVQTTTGDDMGEPLMAPGTEGY